MSFQFIFGLAALKPLMLDSTVRVGDRPDGGRPLIGRWFDR
jgi:hypothetical protein